MPGDEHRAHARGAGRERPAACGEEVARAGWIPRLARESRRRIPAGRAGTGGKSNASLNGPDASSFASNRAFASMAASQTIRQWRSNPSGIVRATSKPVCEGSSVGK
jgi:hypothetical protein